MSIFDDIPLEIGTAWEYPGQTMEIIGWDAAAQRYLVRRTCGSNIEEFWRSREKIEELHGNSLMSGLEITEIKPASPASTRFFRRKEKNADDQ
jgi:hypothetical protein